MSSLDDDPKLLDGLIQECLTAVLDTRPKRGDMVALSRFGEEAYFRQGGSIPLRLAKLVEERTDGQYTIRPADPVLVNGSYHQAGVYFARVPVFGAVPERVSLTMPSDDMVLYEVNPYRHLLTVDLATRTASEVKTLLAEREARRVADEVRRRAEAQLREAVQEELMLIVSRIEFHIQTGDNPAALRKWQELKARYHGDTAKLPLFDLLLLCHGSLGITLAALATHTAATA